MPSAASRSLFLQVSADINPFTQAMKAGSGALVRFSGDVDAQLAEIDKSFANFGQTGAASLQRGFSSALKSIQRDAGDLFSGKGLTLNVAGAQAAADAAGAQAERLQALSVAAAAAAARIDDANSQEALLAVSARAAANAAEQEAVALRGQVLALQRVQAELGPTAANQNELAEGHSRVGASGLIVEHVVRAMSDSIAAGQSPVRALTMEMGRITEAMTLFAYQSNATEGAMGKFVKFMGGPWGIAIQIGVALLTSLGGELLAGGEASEKLHGKLMTLVDALGAEAFATQAAQKALREYNNEKERARDTDSSSTARSLQLAEARLKEAIATRQALQAEALRQATAPIMTPNGGGANAIAAIALDRKANDQSGIIDELNQSIRNLKIDAAETAAKAAADPIERIRQKYKGLADAAKDAAAKNNALANSLTATLSKYAVQEAADVKAEREREHPKKVKLGSSEDYGLAAARAKLATATTDVAVAEAKLDIVRARRPSLKPAQYEAELTQAEQALAVAKALQATADATPKAINAFNDSFHKLFDKDGNDEWKKTVDTINDAQSGRAGQNEVAFDRRSSKPMDDYLRQLHDNTDDMKRSLTSVKVDGLKSIEDGFVGVINGTKTVASAFKEMASTIISDLARIAIEKTLVSFLGLADGGEVGGLSVLKRADGGSIPAFALGGLNGLFRGMGGPRDDKNLVLLSNGEFIVNAAATKENLGLLKAINDNRLPKFADGGLVSTIRYPSVGGNALRPAYAGGKLALDANVHVSTDTEMFDARMTGVSIRTVGAAAEPIMAGAQARTTKSLMRRNLPGGTTG